MTKKDFYFLFCLTVLLLSTSVLSQTKTRKQLEKQRTQIKKEIKEIKQLLFSNSKRKAVAFSDIENLNIKIQRKEELVNLTISRNKPCLV